MSLEQCKLCLRLYRGVIVKHPGYCTPYCADRAKSPPHILPTVTVLDELVTLTEVAKEIGNSVKPGRLRSILDLHGLPYRTVGLNRYAVTPAVREELVREYYAAHPRSGD